MWCERSGDPLRSEIDPRGRVVTSDIFEWSGIRPPLISQIKRVRGDRTCQFTRSSIFTIKYIKQTNNTNKDHFTI